VVKVALLLMFGFRPVTIKDMKVSDMVLGDSHLTFTEGFRKGYFTKGTKLRRLSFPWSAMPGSKLLFTFFLQQAQGAWLARRGSADAWVMAAMH
jgi:hypothetical protein